MEKKYEHKANVIEAHLLTLWCDLLKQAEIRLSDSFFYLGADSITVLKLIFRVKQTFHVTLRYRDVFDNSSISRLAVLIEAKLRTITT